MDGRLLYHLKQWSYVLLNFIAFSEYVFIFNRECRQQEAAVLDLIQLLPAGVGFYSHLYPCSPLWWGKGRGLEQPYPVGRPESLSFPVFSSAGVLRAAHGPLPPLPPSSSAPGGKGQIKRFYTEACTACFKRFNVYFILNKVSVTTSRCRYWLVISHAQK